MSQEAPEWLTAELVSESLGEEVTGLSVAVAAPPGNNYGSLVTRLSVALKGRAEPVSLIVKSELTDDDDDDTTDDVPDLTETIEHDFYYKFIPEARKVTETSFAPRAFPIKIATSVILEDLKSRGFEMADRQKQLDFEHCRLYMTTAAKLHAVSVAVHRANPELVESIGEEKMYANLDGWAHFKKLVVGGTPNLLQAVNKLEKFPRASRIIASVKDNLWEMIVDAHKRRKGINTLNQGDPWTTNMMFKYDENRRVREMKLLDFQCLRFTSPVTDIVMFIWSSANHDVKSSRLPELYNIYLQSFNKNLKDFGCDETFTEEDFTDEIRKMSPSALFIVGSFLPVVLDPVPMDEDKLYKDEVKFFEHYYNEQFCSYHLPKSIEQLERAGVFDYLEQCQLIRESREK